VTLPVRVLALICCLALAGCVGPFSQSGPASQSPDSAGAGVGDAIDRRVNLSLSNWGDVDYTVRVTLVAGPVERVTVSYVNGTSETRTVDEEYYLPGRLTNATGLRVDGRVVATRVFQLDPDTYEDARYRTLPSNTTVVYTASPADRDTIAGWNVLRCRDSDDTHEVAVNLLSARSVSVTASCRG
jgi:hypothetical protein